LKTLWVFANRITSLPISIVKLEPEKNCSFKKNKLNPKKLPAEILAWLDKWNPDWRDKQFISK